LEQIKDMQTEYTLDPSARPREKLLRKGASALSDQDLLTLLLCSGNNAHDVRQLAGLVLAKTDHNRGTFSLSQLLEVEGIDTAKAATIVAALEFSRRRIAVEGLKVRSPGDVASLVAHLCDRKQEVFVCISLSGAHEVIASRIITVGLANMCQVHPREVLADAIVDRACSIIVAHNHPSGELIPSEEDLNVTKRLQTAASIIGIKLLDHIIFSRKGYYSILHASSRIKELRQAV
jgi:DNA repair protein RadC